MAYKDFWNNCDHSRLEKLLKSEKNLIIHKRIQCVHLRAHDKLTAHEIANIVGLSSSTVYRIQNLYQKKGEEAFKLKPKGGRYNSNMSLAEERDILSHFAKDGAEGGILEVNKIKAAYEEKLGRKVHKTVIYRMLYRHGWRKITPRKKHPKNDKQAMKDFKKNFHYWCPRQNR